jgi:2-dehydropantoate 2-reductase
MTRVEKKNILVFGAGAIGTYLGGSLAVAGNRVVFIEQPTAVQELTHRGLILDLTIDRRLWSGDTPASGVHRPTSIEFETSLVEAFKKGPFDFALFALKSFDTSAAAESMKPFADRLPPVLCLSNGVENEPLLASILGMDKVIPGTITSSVGRREVGDIVLERLRGVGVADRHPLSLFLVEALNAAGLNAHLYLNPADMKWSKMLTNLPANATAAILDLTAAEVFTHTGLYRLEMRMLRETLAVMHANHFRVINLPGVPVKALGFGTRLPEFLARPLMQKAIGGGRGGKMPSFHIDLHSGRGKSEVNWLNGAIVRYGEKAGVPTPINKILTETLLALTQGEIPLGRFRHQPDELLSLI